MQYTGYQDYSVHDKIIWQNMWKFKTQRFQLKTKMCCPTCEEMVLEKIWEVPGVLDVRASWIENKVVVTAMPWPVEMDKNEVQRRVRKIDPKARFVKLTTSKKPFQTVRKRFDHYPERIHSGYYMPPDYSFLGYSLPHQQRRPSPRPNELSSPPSLRMATRPSTSYLS